MDTGKQIDDYTGDLLQLLSDRSDAARELIFKRWNEGIGQDSGGQEVMEYLKKIM